MDRRGGRLSRRQFVAGVGGLGLLAGCGRLPWQAQPPAKIPRLGVLVPDEGAGSAMAQSLRELGYVEGQGLILELRLPDGVDERFSDLASDLVRLPVDVIYAVSTPATQAARRATSTIPIIMNAGGNPVETGLVESFARPGGNVTGVSFLDRPLATKRLELLKQAVPSVSRVAVLWGGSNPALQLVWNDLQAAAPALGVELQSVLVGDPDDFSHALASVTQRGADGLVTLAENALNVRRTQVVDFAATKRLPAMYHQSLYVREGGLMAYAASRGDSSRRAAYYVDRILKGTKPADLPVEQPMTFDFVVNMKTAQALGITFPSEILLQVTEAID